MPPAPSKLNWRELAARASCLDERLRGEVISDEAAPVSTRIVDARLARWRELAAGGDEARFAAVLAARGLDLASARQALGDVRLRAGAPLPAWTRTARRLATLALREARRCSVAATATSDFWTVLFRPALRLARESVRRRAGHAAYRGLCVAAHRDLENYLLRRLGKASEEALALELCIHRSLDRSWDQGGPLSEDVARQQFIRGLRRRGGLAELFRLFPALARLCSEMVDAWVTSTAEFLRRLARDRQMLGERFFLDGDGRNLRVGQVCTLAVGVGDEHRGGRSVLILGFDRGGTRRLVYKPRDLRVDLAWFDLLGAVNAENLSHPLRQVRVWPRGSSYGWMEFVVAAPSQDRAALARYSWRAGALACLFHALGGTDGHRENLVAEGDQPVLVDLETLLHHPDPKNVSPWPLAHTVFRTALLPLPLNAEKGDAAPSPEEKKRWSFPPAFGPSGMGAQDEVAADELLAGFRAMARLLTKKRPPPAVVKRVRRLTQQQVRRVLLPTAFYDLLLRRSLAAGCLREGIDRSLEFEFLRREALGENRREPWIGEEVRALERLDIPYFTARPDATDGKGKGLLAEWARETGNSADPSASSVRLRRHLAAQIVLLKSSYLHRQSSG